MWPCAIKVWLRAAEFTQPSPENRRKKYFGEVFHTPLRHYTLSVFVKDMNSPCWTSSVKKKKEKEEEKKEERKKEKMKQPLSLCKYIS